ncbi:MAG: tetratricopeptide repeat protein [Bdellovibrionales bacterium]|nr:tetratricopeptide repeat protein [Bdellovibrionales bacterium]
MHSGPLFKVKHHTGRILGPLDLERIKKLILKNQITGVELAKEYPNGIWQDINRLPELAELLYLNASGKLTEGSGALKSEQSSYRPILSPTREQFAPTVVLPSAPVPAEPAEIESKTSLTVEHRAQVRVQQPKAAIRPADPDRTRVADEDDEPTMMDPRGPNPMRAEAADSGGTATALSTEPPPESLTIEDGTELVEVKGSHPLVEVDSHAEPMLPDPLSDPGFKKRVQEVTVALYRPGLEPAKKKRRIPKGKELVRIVLIAAALGYFGYDTFMKETTDVAGNILKKSESFRPTLPRPNPGKVDSAYSEKEYKKGIFAYSFDHVPGYKAAAIHFSNAVTADPENLKAYAMLASAYVNLIDTSTKDETFFSVISQLLDSAKAKGIDLPELIIAESEFLTVTGRPDAAIQRIVNYTKGMKTLDPSLYLYIAEAFLAKGDAKSASPYVQSFQDNQAWSPRIFYVRGRIAEALGDTGAATAQYDKALLKWKEHAKSRLRRVYVAWKGGNVKSSAEDLNTILKFPDALSPKDLAQAYYLYSQLFSVNQNSEGALIAIERALKLDRTNRDYILEYYTLQARENGSSSRAKAIARMYLNLGEGEKKLKEGLVNDALAKFLDARAENPKSAEPLVKIGDMFVQLNDMVNARLNYQKAAELEPNSIEVWSKYISVLIQSYEWDEAQKAMDKFRKLPVSQSSIDKAAGDMYAKQNRYVEAAAFYKKAMSRESIDPDVYIAYGKILMAVKSYKDAPFFFALARRFDPLNPEPVIQTAKAAAEVEGPDSGIEYLEGELQKGSFARAELLAAIAELEIKKGQWKEAEQYVEQSRQANPEYAYPWKLQAQIYLNDENTDKKALDKALDAFKSYSDRNSSDPSGYLSRYQIFMKKAQFEKAQAELERIYAIYPKYPNLHYYKGLMYTNMGNYKLAAEEYGTELANNDLSVPSLIALGKAKIELGDAKGALVPLAKAMGLQPNNSEAKMNAAIANHRMKNYAGAIALFQAAIQLDAGNPILYKRMGECYRDMGDLIAARGAFQKYLQMEPDAADKADIERYL